MDSDSLKILMARFVGRSEYLMPLSPESGNTRTIESVVCAKFSETRA
jgi:hypothetical protein